MHSMLLHLLPCILPLLLYTLRAQESWSWAEKENRSDWQWKDWKDWKDCNQDSRAVSLAKKHEKAQARHGRHIPHLVTGFDTKPLKFLKADMRVLSEEDRTCFRAAVFKYAMSLRGRRRI